MEARVGSSLAGTTTGALRAARRDNRWQLPIYMHEKSWFSEHHDVGHLIRLAGRIYKSDSIGQALTSWRPDLMQSQSAVASRREGYIVVYGIAQMPCVATDEK
jgi:hypothetical protein